MTSGRPEDENVKLWDLTSQCCYRASDVLPIDSVDPSESENRLSDGVTTVSTVRIDGPSIKHLFFEWSLVQRKDHWDEEGILTLISDRYNSIRLLCVSSTETRRF